MMVEISSNRMKMQLSRELMLKIPTSAFADLLTAIAMAQRQATEQFFQVEATLEEMFLPETGL